LASALLVGLVAGVLLAQIPYITIEKKIDLDGMVSLFIGLVLFFGLNLLYQQQSTVRQGEKDILMKLAQDGSQLRRCWTAPFASTTRRTR